MSTISRILILDPDDTVISGMDRLSLSWPSSSVRLVRTPEEMRSALMEDDWDAVLYAVGRDRTEQPAVIAALRETRSDLPVVFFSEAGILRQVYEEDERRRQALEMSEMHYKLLADHAADVIWMSDFRMNVTYASPSVFKLRGYTVEETLRQSPAEILAEESYEVAREMLELNIPHGSPDPQKTQEPRVYELYLTRKNAPPVPTETAVTVIYDADNQPVGMLAVSRDITERKRMENELRLREERLRKAQAIAHLGDWEWDSVLNTISCSDEVIRLFGIDESQARNPDTFVNTIHPEDRATFLATLRRAAEQSTTFATDCRIIRPDGVERVLHNEGEGLPPDRDRPRRVLGTVQDITELKHAEAELRRLSHRLLEVQENERRQIASMLDDEAGQSLAVLKLMLNKIAQSPLPGDVLTTIEEAKRIIDGLVNDIRRLSTSLRPSMLDHMGLLPTLEWYFRDVTARTNLRINFEHEGTDSTVHPEVNIAAYRIIQEALTNVVRHAGVGQATVRVEIGRASMSLEIEDRGRGFDPKKVPERASGLSGIVERTRDLGGTTSIRSAPGQGTRIVVSLPLKRRIYRRGVSPRKREAVTPR